MLTINPKEISVPQMHGYLLGAITPRPIAFASTMDKEGNINLSPFSFFNVFSANPPILIFSPSRRGRDNSTKHTLENVLEHPEVVINLTDYAMAEQMSLASTEYDKGVNEFIKAGLTMEPSVMVKPPRVGEAPAAFECKVNEIVSLGPGGGAGNLVISEVLLAHFQDHILDENKKIDPRKMDAIARLGANWYARITPDSLFEIEKPAASKGIGVDQIPETIRNSNILTGNDLGRLGNIEHLPDRGSVDTFGNSPEVMKLKERYSRDPEEFTHQLHLLASEYIKIGDTETAWKVLLQNVR